MFDGRASAALNCGISREPKCCEAFGSRVRSQAAPIARKVSMSRPEARWASTPNGYLMVLRQGDDVIAELERLAELESIEGATFSGFGFAGLVRFGFFDYAKAEYVPREFTNVEMGSLNGSIAWKDGKPSIHMHGVGAGDDYKAVGGHVLQLIVGRGSVELVVTNAGRRLSRALDETIGANILRL